MLNDPRFDSVTRVFASGQSRRGVLKALLAIGGGAVTGVGIGSANAARRPTPTPKPITCPGQQVWNGTACVCQSGAGCGPDCCPAEAVCCDNACCYGTCYAEELCCPSPQEWCAVSGECCPEGWSCSAEFGCREAGWCRSDTDCQEGVCARSICMENQICSEMLVDCNLGGSSVCCDANMVCHEDGSCLPASISLSFVPEMAGNNCLPFATLAGFLPNSTYDIQFRGDRAGSPISPIWRQVTTDPLGAFAAEFNILYVNDLDEVFVTVENVTSALVPVTC